MDSVAAAYGYESLKDKQKSIILTSFVKGKDVFGCLPTGFGKSACFLLLPSIFDRLHTQPSGTNMVLVIAPLTSLINDQVASCTLHGISGIGETKESDVCFEDVMKGKYQILYMSPEWLC